MSEAISVPAVRAGGGRDWFGQPRGLTILFLTDTWEMFSYYGMRTILVLYMTRGLQFTQPRASLVYGLYTGFVFATPLLGGVIADRWLGRRRAVLAGGLIMAAGHFLLAFDQLLFAGLATIAIGNGLFLPSLPAQVAPLYPDDDPRRRSAINIYYLGVNLGAFFAPFVCGSLGEELGWHYGFAASGTGMLVALATYVAGSTWLPPDPPRAPRAARPAAKTDRAALDRAMLMLGIMGSVVLFRAAYEQAGNTVALWSAEAVDRRLGALIVPATWFIAINPLLILVLTPVLVRRWNRLAARGKPPRTARLMARGAAIVAGAYGLLALGSLLSGAAGASALWLVAYFALLTWGELHILPIGLGLFPRIAPAGLGATAVGFWFLAAFFGNLAAGLLGRLWNVSNSGPFFLAMSVLALASAALLRAFDRPVARAEATGAG